MSAIDREREAIRRWFDGALRVVAPRPAVRSALAFEDGEIRIHDARVPLGPEAKLVVVAIGKAAVGMAQGARDVLGDRIDCGFILTKYGHLDGEVGGFLAFEAGHPTPDDAGLEATNQILAALNHLGTSDVVIALISGGGSALLELPRPGVTLDDIQEVTRRLMHAGAGIHDLNVVRKALSQTKGGGLRRAMGEATCATLLLSDVLGNDPATIASGPTVIASEESNAAREVLDRFGLANEVPEGVLAAVHSPDVGSAGLDTSRDVVTVIADNATFVTEIAHRAIDDGLTVQYNTEPYEGDAATLGRELVHAAWASAEDVDVLLRGGEATVEVTGEGVGGRNTEMALAAAMALDGRDDWVVASLASDGDDGNSGAAGAIADGGTLVRARARGIDPGEALARNDSATVFRHAGGIVETGPTGTNVNDVYLALRVGRVTERKGTT